MTNPISSRSVRAAEKALTKNALSDLKNFLDAIKGRTTLLTNSVNPDSPLQEHFQEMMIYVNESLETTDFLSDSFEFDTIAEEIK